MRPRTFDEFVGQEELLAPGKPLREAIERDLLQSIILWGPPGTGKTTLARIIADTTKARFVSFSAVLSGIKEIRDVMAVAEQLRRTTGRRTIVFIDEIHRFNKAQQDAFLPRVEAGDIVLIGATTENPSFEVNSALLSRAKVYVLQPLSTEDVAALLARAVADPDRGLGKEQVVVDQAALPAGADGTRRLDPDALAGLVERRALLYDKGGEEHYNIVSALHKSIRNSDADAGLYWLARMLEAGEDPLYVARRLVRFASEDVGLADPQALVVAMAAQQAVHFLGMPEGALALAELVVYLAMAPKSNSVYVAYGKAVADVANSRNDPVPLHLRNAPTSLMKDLGYGAGYKYAHDFDEGVIGQQNLPDNLA